MPDAGGYFISTISHNNLDNIKDNAISNGKEQQNFNVDPEIEGSERLKQDISEESNDSSVSMSLPAIQMS